MRIHTRLYKNFTFLLMSLLNCFDLATRPHGVGGDVPPAGPPAERSATTTEGQGNASADKQHAPVTPGSGAQDIKQ